MLMEPKRWKETRVGVKFSNFYKMELLSSPSVCRTAESWTLVNIPDTLIIWETTCS